MNTQSSGGASALTIILYTLATVAFLLALVLLVGVFNLDAAIEGNAFLLRSIMGPLADVLLAGVLSAAQIVGVLMATILGSMGILLVGGGQLAARHASLVTRVLRMETFLGIGPADVKAHQEPMDQRNQQTTVFNQGLS